MTRIMAALLLAATATATDAQAQQPQRSGQTLTDTAAQRIVAFYNSDATTRLGGDSRIAAGTVVRGGVALLVGTLTIDGVVDGDVVVINGNLVMQAPGARVEGSITVTGGRALIEAPASVAGDVVIYQEPLSYRHSDTGIDWVRDDSQGLVTGRDFSFGRTDLLIATQGAYNRTEGLPFAIGPRIRSSGAYPTMARALVIFRTATTSEAASDLDLSRIGYDLRAEQTVMPSAGLTVGASLYSEVTAIEDGGVSDRENALSTFVLHRDRRDHYEREGWSLYAHMERPGSPYTVELTYRDERHAAIPAADPFTLLYRQRDWRPQPSVGQGRIRSIGVDGTYDTRNEVSDPSAGWLARLSLEQGLGGSFDNPGSIDPEMLALLRRTANADYRTIHIDIRRYARLSPYARIGLRVFGAGSLDARALPPQHQHALGGEGSLPGYGLFEFDCGARTSTVALRGDSYHPYYGCDQVALVQLEYQAGFPFARRLAQSLGLTSSISQHVRWVAFFDAGRAWNEPAARDGRTGGNNDFSADAGLGVRLGPLGIYWAAPLSGNSDGFNFFVRLGPRI